MKSNTPTNTKDTRRTNGRIRDEHTQLWKTYESVQNNNCRVAGDEFTSPDRARQREHRRLLFTTGDRALHSLHPEKDQTFGLRVLLFTFFRYTLTAELATDRPIAGTLAQDQIARPNQDDITQTGQPAPCWDEPIGNRQIGAWGRRWLHMRIWRRRKGTLTWTR